MFPLSPSCSSISSLPPSLDTISELDILSDISEDDPLSDDPLSWTGQMEANYPGIFGPASVEHGDSIATPEPDVPGGCPSPAHLDCGSEQAEDGATPPEAPSPRGFSLSGLCKGLRRPLLLDEDGYICFPSLPEDCASFLPSSLQRYVPLASPSLVPSFLLLVAVLLSASQSLPVSLCLALPLALSLCYLEPKASMRRGPLQQTDTVQQGELCDPAA